MFATGFSMNVAQIAEGAARETQQFLASEAEWRDVHLVGGIVRVAPDGRGRNEAVVFAPDGTEQARYQKMHPFTYGGESNHYGPGRAPVLFRLGDWSVAPFICYDLRFPEIFRVAARTGAELFLVIANWPEARVAHWTTLLQARAIENQAYVVGVNRVGDDPTPLRYPGRSLIIGPRGDILADAGNEERVISATLDRGALLDYRRQLPFLADMRPDYVPAPETA
jgi:predicted amidohydrolase